jgi:Do/DeqQ family serine protease
VSERNQPSEGRSTPPTSGPAVDPATQRAFGRPDGIQGAFAGREHRRDQGEFAPTNQSPGPVLDDVFGRPKVDDDDSDAAEPWPQQPEGEAPPPPTAAAPAPEPGPPGPKLGLVDLLFSGKVSKAALAVIIVLALLVGLAGGWMGSRTATIIAAFSTPKVDVSSTEPAEESDGRFTKVANAVADSVVTIEALSDQSGSQGSGVVVDGRGYIVTNNHVVENADTITVRTNDDRELKAKLVGRDPATDLAVIKVEGSAFPYVSFEDKAKPRVGDWVIAVGNPFGLGGTATAGIVSALARSNVSGSSYVDYMQIDAPINRGNSGGPSFDLNGRVVGVNSAIFSPSGGSVGIGFDIPADVVQKVSRTLIDHGKVVRGYLGASVQGITPEVAESMGLKAKKGALIAQVTAGGPAARSGLQTGDVVTRIDGHEVESNADLTRQVALVSPGQDMRLTVLREGRTQEITVKSGERPSEEALARNDQQDGRQERGRR